MRIGPFIVAMPIHEARLRRYGKARGREFVITGVSFGSWMVGVIRQRQARSIWRRDGGKPF